MNANCQNKSADKNLRKIKINQQEKIKGKFEINNNECIHTAKRNHTNKCCARC
jgi:hypothetical protein